MSAEADADPRSWAEGVPTARAQVKTALTNTRQLLEHLSDWTDQVADIGDAWNREHRPWARGLPSGSPGGFTHDKRARIKLGIETMNAMDALSDPEGRKMIEQWLDRPVSSGTRPSVRTNRVDLRQLWFAKNAREAVISYLATKDDGAQQFVEAAEAAGLLVRTKGKRPSQAEEPLPGAPAWDDWIMIDDSSAAETGWAFAPIRLEDASDAIAALPFYPGDDVLGAHQMSRGIVDDWAGSSSGDLDAWITQLASARVGDSSVPMYPTASQLLDIATDQSLPSGGSGEFAGDESLDFYDLDGDLNQAFTNRAMGLDGDEHSFAWKRLLATKMYERTQQWLDDEGFSDSSTFMFFRGAGWEQVTDDGYRHGIQPGAGRRPDLVDYVGPSLIEELGRVGLDPTDEEIDHPDGPGAMALDPGEDVISNPLSSWTASAKIADQFNDFTLITRVPRTALLSTFVTGLGCASEAEFVLRADVLDSLKSNMWLWRNYPDSRF